MHVYCYHYLCVLLWLWGCCVFAMAQAGMRAACSGGEGFQLAPSTRCTSGIWRVGHLH
jgi:hypothetical protein